MALVSKATQEMIKHLEGINPQGVYQITDHRGKEVKMNGVELKAYFIAHRNFIGNIEFEQPKEKLKTTKTD
jgi:hypothetical protein